MLGRQKRQKLYPFRQKDISYPTTHIKEILESMVTNPRDPFSLKLQAQTKIIKEIHKTYCSKHGYSVWKVTIWNTLIETEKRFPWQVKLQLEDNEDYKKSDLYRQYVPKLQE